MSSQTLKRSLQVVTSVAFLLSVALAAPLAQATSYYWDIDGNIAGPGGTAPAGTWTTSGTTWSTSSAGTAATPAYTTTTSDDLYFSAGTTATGAWTCNVTGVQYAHSITVEEGTVNLKGANNASVGTAYVNSGATLKIEGDNVLATTCLLSLNGGTFDLSGYAQQVAGLAGSTGTVKNSGGDKELNINFASGSQTYGGAITGSNISIRKSGAGTQTLTGANTYTGETRIYAGALGVGDSLVGLSANSTIAFWGDIGSSAGGVLEGNGTFNRGLGISAGQVKWEEGNGGTKHDGGFSARGNKLTVNIGGASALMTWQNTTYFVNGDHYLMFGSTTADNEVEFQNPIDMNGTTSKRGYIWVTDNTGSPNDFATLSGVLSNGQINKLGNGTLKLSGNNTFTNGVTISTGVLQVGNAGALNSSSPNTVTFGLSAPAGTKLQLYGNSVTVGGLSTNSTPGSPVVESGSTTAGTDTLTVYNSSSNTYAGVLQDGSTRLLALTKSNSGTLTLANTTANTFTGTTAVNGGTLKLDYTSSQNIQKIAPGAGLILGGGTLQLTPFTTGSGTVQTLGSGLTLNAGASAIVLDTSVSGTIFTLNGITRNTGATLNYTRTASGNITTSTANANFTGGQQTILGGYATVGGTSWAVSGTGGTAGTITALGTYNAGFLAGKDVNANTSGPASMTINSLRFNASAVVTLGGALTVATGGILETSAVGNAQVQITGSTLTSGNGTDLIVINNNPDNSLEIASQITGSIDLTKAGAGKMTLSSTANNYTGATYIMQGTLLIGTSNVIPNGSAVTIGNGATGATLNVYDRDETIGSLTLNNGTVQGENATTKTLTIGGDVLATGTSGIFTVSNVNGAKLDLGGASRIIEVTGPTDVLTVNGIIQVTGAYGITKTGAGTLVLKGWGSTYTGGTTINAGTLQLNGADRLADTGAVTVSGGTLDMQANNDTVGAVTLTSGSIIGTGTLTGSSYDVQSGTASAILGGTSVALTKSTAGTVTLSGANTYTGATSVNAGVLNIQNALATGTVAGGVTVAGGAALEMQGTIAVGAEALTINGTGIAGGGALRSVSGTNSWAGTVALNDSTSNYIGVDANTLTLSGVISGTGMPLTKVGAGTLVLSTAINTYTGATIINAGTISIDNNVRLGSTSNTITFNGGTLKTTVGITNARNITLNPGGGTLDAGGVDSTYSGIISGAGALTYAANLNGSLTLSGTNTYAGGTTINGGTQNDENKGLRASNTSALGTGDVTIASTGNLLLYNSSLNIGGLNGSAGGSVSRRGMEATQTLTINNAPGVTNTFTGNIRGYSTTGNGYYIDVVKTGPGTQVFNGNTVTSEGMRNTSVNGGTLRLDYTTDNNSKLRTGGSLSLGGGTLKLTPNTAGTTQTLGSGLTLNAGASAIVLDDSVAGTAFTLGSITRNTGSTIDYSKPANGNIKTTKINVSGILGGWFTVGGADWAVGSADGATSTNITALGAVTELPLTGGGTGNNYQLTGASQNQSGTVTAKSLKITGGEGNTLALGTNPLTFTTTTTPGGLLSTVNYTISGSGAGILGAGSTGEFIVSVASGKTLTVSAPIIGNSTGILTKAGAGTLTLTGTNSYTGSTYLTAGVLRATAGTGMPTASNLQFVGGVLESSGAATFTRALGTGAGQVYWNGGSGGFSAYSTGPAGDKMTVNIGNALGTMTWGGTNFVPDGFNLRFGSTNANRETEFQNPINLGNWPRTVEVRSGAGGDKATLSGAITGTGAGGLVKTGSGVLALSSTGNTFSGGIQVKAGTVSVGADSNLGSPLSEFYGVTLDAGTLQIAGTSAFSTAKSIRLNSGGGTIDAVNSNITPPALSGAISGTGGLIKTGTGALVLSSANVTYTGATTVKAGVLFVNTLLSSTSGVSVQTSGTLAGTGTISAPVTIDSGAFLSPGASIGQLNLSNGITIHGQLDAEISWSPTTTSDVLALTGGNLVLDSDTSILNVIGDLAGAPPFTEYTIATVSGGGTVTGTFKTLKNNGNPGLPPMWSVLITTNSIKVIPEPATMALLGLGGVAMLLGRRRSRKS